MQNFAVFKTFQTIGSIVAVALFFAMSLSMPVWAEPTPVTPSTVNYQIEHSKSPVEVGQKLQQQSQDYKQELQKSPTPVPNAAKRATEKTKSIFQLFSKRVQETTTNNAPLR